jgi:UDP-N-acetylglucosamine 1-carboxyvinyltransferase
MDKFVIQGGVPLSGTVVPSGNKNAALPILAATLLTDQPVTLRNLPNIGDVRTMLSMLEKLGASVVRQNPHTVTVRVERITSTCPDPGMAGQIRGSLTVLGPILARAGQVSLSLPGGDRIGRRRIDTHLMALAALGADVQQDGGLELRSEGLRGADIWLDEASVTGTENAVMAATPPASPTSRSCATC